MSTIHVIIVAAGSGLRFGAPLPKQFCLLDGRPVVMWTIDAFRHQLPEATISLVISESMDDYWSDLCDKYKFESPQIVFGGSTRWESVKNALASVDDRTDIVMIHDAVRPIVTSELIKAVVSPFDGDRAVDGVLPAIAVTDTIRQLTSDGLSEVMLRSSLRAVQTPQAFYSQKLKIAYNRPYDQKFTDDASVMEAAGYKNLLLSEGSPFNIKITNPGDIEIASLYLRTQR